MNNASHRPKSDSARGTTLYDRQNALWRGLPAALIAVMGLTALVFATDRNSKLEQRYRRWAEDATKERNDLGQKIYNELRVLESGQANKSLDELIPPDDKRRISYEQASVSERLYYEKLIALNANEPEYRYQFANACVNSRSNSDRQRGLSLMETLAPLNQIGFHKAHLWWAEHFWSLMQFGKIEPQVAAELVFNHADNCLKRQTGDTNALIKKGESAMILGRNDDALAAFTELFDADPFYYEVLTKINNRLNRSDANTGVYLSTKGRIETRLRSEMSVDQWCRHWEVWTQCMVGLEDYAEANDRLREEIKVKVQKQDSFSQIFLEQLLSRVLVAIHRKQHSKSGQFSTSDLELVKEALLLDKKNPEVQQILTRMVMSENSEISAAAKQVYDPMSDLDAPSLVLNELGAVALTKKEYPKAIMYMEKARAKQPNDWTTLNNLAYVYLVAENRNPERALKLVDEAIRKIPNPDVAKNVTTFFLDTKGTALMQLNRMPEAIAAFELALKDRPDNIKILENLIKCYEASNLSAEAYKERLKKLSE